MQAMLGQYDNVMAYFTTATYHAGNYGAVDGVHYVTVEGMLETADTTAYAVIEVYKDRVEMKGFGRASNRTLPHPAQ